MQRHSLNIYESLTIPFLRPFDDWPVTLQPYHSGNNRKKNKVLNFENVQPIQKKVKEGEKPGSGEKGRERGKRKRKYSH